MKMGSSLFWGIILIVIGLSLVVKIVFNVDFPIFKIIVAFIFIYIGLKIMLGSSFRPFHGRNTETDVVFGQSKFSTAPDGKEYNVVFSKGNFDFRDIQLKPDGPTFVKIHTVFAGSQVLIRKDMPVRIRVEAAFAGAQLPNGNTTAFGSTLYTSENLDTTKPFLDIQAETVFGGLHVLTF
jgi:predicted membrane protein